MVTSHEYSEVRYDADGNGVIDTWSFSKGSMTVQEYFLKGKLSEVKIQQIRKSHILNLLYTVRGAQKLELVSYSISPHVRYFNDLGGLATLEEPDDDSSSCQQTPFSKVVNESTWKSFICKTNEAERNGLISEMLGESCKDIPVKDRENMLQGLRSIYGLKYDGYIEDNKALSCLASTPSLRPLLPMYINRIAIDIQQPKGIKVECYQHQGLGCGKASYSNQDGLAAFRMPYSEPGCTKDMLSEYTENFFHESLHRAFPKSLSEQSIQAVVKGCLGNEKSELSKVALNETNDTDKHLSTSAPAATASAVQAQNQTVQPPANAATLANPAATLANSAGDSSSPLNSGFRNVASADSGFNPNQAVRDSVARTGSSLSTFEAIANQFVTPAVAATTSWAASNSNSGSGSGSSASNRGTSQWLNSGAPQIGSALAQGPQVTTGSVARSPSSEEAASGAAVKSAKATSARNAAGASGVEGSAVGGRNVGGANVDIQSNGKSGSHAGEVGAPKAALTEGQQKRAEQLIQNIERQAKTVEELRILLSSNEEKLRQYKIFVFDPAAAGGDGASRKGNYGAKIDEAALKYSLSKDKRKLVKE